MQMKNLALAGQEVVFDVEAIHSFQMSPQYRHRDQICNSRRLIVSRFDGVKYF